MTRYEMAGKTVAVTGGARGIGLAIARACSEAGMSVAIGDLSEAASTEADPKDIALQVEVNLGGALTGTQLALEKFLPRGSGHVVNLASTAAMVASPYGATYTATKHAVLGFTRALRGELRGSGVLSTVVLPGVIRTEMTTEFKSALGVRSVEPEAVGVAVVAALRQGTPEVYVPREVALQGRLFTTLPARLADRLSRLTGADSVMR